MSNRPIEIVTVKNNICLQCDIPLTEESLIANREKIRIYYKCNKCGKIYLIKHNESDFSKISPIYSKYDIPSFIEDFGEPIQDRRNKILIHIRQFK